MRISDWSSDVCSSDLWNTASVHQKQPPAKTAVSRVIAASFAAEGGGAFEIGMRRPYSKGGGSAISGGSSGRPAASAAWIAAISCSIERTRSRQRGRVPGGVKIGRAPGRERGGAD